MTTTGERLIKSAHEAAAMAPEQQTIEAVAKVINTFRYGGYPLGDSKNTDLTWLQSTKTAHAVIETLKSLDWQPPQKKDT